MAELAYLVRIHPTRTNFLSTTTPAEAEVMRSHFDYWTSRIRTRELILAGPVPIEQGTFGILILRAKDTDGAEELVKGDPAVSSGTMAFEIFPLRLALYEGDPGNP